MRPSTSAWLELGKVLSATHVLWIFLSVMAVGILVATTFDRLQ